MKTDTALWDRLALAGVIGFGVLAGLGALEILFAPMTSRWVALATLACLASAFACWALRLQHRRLARHPYRVVSERHTVTFAPDAEALAQGLRHARGTARAESVLESLRPDQTTVRLQKFVTEETDIDARALLEAWGYVCRAGPNTENRATVGDFRMPCEVAPFVSPSRSLQIDAALPAPVGRGETFVMEEEFEFAGDLDAPGGSFMFQVAYPTRRREVAVVFEGLRPERAWYRLERGAGGAEEGALSPETDGDGRTVLRFAWPDPRVGEELGLHWTWDAESLPEAKPRTDATIQRALAEQAGEEAVEKLAARFAAPEEGPVADDTSAEDHPIIKAARAREALYRRNEDGGGE